MTTLPHNTAIVDLTNKIVFLNIHGEDFEVDLEETISREDEECDIWSGFSNENAKEGWDMNLWWEEGVEPTITVYVTRPNSDGEVYTVMTEGTEVKLTILEIN